MKHNFELIKVTTDKEGVVYECSFCSKRVLLPTTDREGIKDLKELEGCEGVELELDYTATWRGEDD